MLFHSCSSPFSYKSYMIHVSMYILREIDIYRNRDTQFLLSSPLLSLTSIAIPTELDTPVSYLSTHVQKEDRTLIISFNRGLITSVATSRTVGEIFNAYRRVRKKVSPARCASRERSFRRYLFTSLSLLSPASQLLSPLLVLHT